jgi:hypothetical protein
MTTLPMPDPMSRKVSPSPSGPKSSNSRAKPQKSISPYRNSPLVALTSFGMPWLCAKQVRQFRH